MKHFISHPVPLGHRIATGTMALFITLSAGVMAVQPALADTAPPVGTPATVSVDPLPTVQINGIVWKQAIYGNTVYAAGKFTQARPAGVAVGGAGSVTRVGLLAYDITTGLLDTNFVHNLSGGNSEARSVAVSPDGTRLYVGGNFGAIDNGNNDPVSHANFAAIDLTTNKVLSGYPGTNAKVNSIAATNTQVYIGGQFTTAGGQNRIRLAAYNTNGTLNTGWVANVTGPNIAAMLISPTNDKLIVGGSMSAINGQTYYGNGAVSLVNGAPILPWASTSSSFPIRLQPPVGASATGVSMTSLATDGTQVFFGAFTYLPGFTTRLGTFEGRAAISPVDGTLLWANDCAGDTYDVYPIGQVLYSATHAHDCSQIGGFPNGPNQRALAETTIIAGVDGPGMGGNYPSYAGIPRTTLLNWFPVLSTANVSGSNQAAWSVTGTSQYLALGGEFPTANGKAQQGLVRYAIASLAPNKVGPKAFASGSLAVAAADASGNSVVTMKSTSDPDSSMLTFRLYRSSTSTPLATWTKDTRFWITQTWTYTDTGITPGTSIGYKLTATDPFGNVVTTSISGT